MPKAFVPAPGDVIWLDLDPAQGHEQGGHRPALVLSGASYNQRTGLAVCCPTTTKVKGFAFEVALSGARPSVVLCDQIRCVAWQARRAVHKGRATADELAEVKAKLAALLGIR